MENKNNKNNKKVYKASNEEKSKLRKIIESKKFRNILKSGVCITCIVAGIYTQNFNLLKTGGVLLLDTIDLTKFKVKYSDIQEQEKIINQNINKDLAIQ